MTETQNTSRKDLLISVVNGNDRGYIYECIESILRHTQGISYDVVVIDNCTGDTKLHRLEEMGVRVIVNDAPQGFSANHAQSLPYLDKYRYLLIFNDDAFLLNNAFQIMVSKLDQEAATVIAGCHIEDPDGCLQPSAASFPTLSYFVKNTLGLDKETGERYPSLFKNYINFENTQLVDWVSGCCMLIKSNFIYEHGFLDEGYFMFLEDADICKRAQSSGHHVMYISEARVVHYGGGSSKDGERKIKPFLFLETQRSRLRYLRKDLTWKYVAYFGFIYAYIPLKIIKSVARGEKNWARDTISLLLNRPIF